MARMATSLFLRVNSFSYGSLRRLENQA